MHVNLKFSLAICLLLITSTSSVFGQTAEVVGTDAILLFENPLNNLKRNGVKDVENYTDENGGIFSINGESVRYAPNMGQDGGIITKKLSDLSIANLTYEEGNMPKALQVISKEGSYITELIQTDKNNNTVVMRLKFDTGLNLIESTKLAEFKLSEGQSFYQRSLDKNTMLFSAVKITNVGKTEVSINISYALVSMDGEVSQKNDVTLSNITKQQYFNPVEQVGYSLVLFNDNNFSFNYGGKIYQANTESNNVMVLDYKIEKTIKSYKYVVGENGKTYMLGCYKEDDKFGFAVLELSEDKNEIADQNYYPIAGLTATELLWYQKKYIKFGQFTKFEVSEAVIDKNGVVTAVLLGYKSDNPAYAAYPINWGIVRCADGKILSEKVVPYANMEAAFLSVQANTSYVTIQNNNVRILYTDYNDHYGPDYSFINSKDKPKARLSQAIYTYDFETGESVHKQISVKMPEGIEFNSLSYKPEVHKLNGTDNYVVIVTEWGIASMKSVYYGILTFEE